MVPWGMPSSDPTPAHDAGAPASTEAAGLRLLDDVLRAVECVPRGRMVSYGDIAALVGTGPRQVGRVMSRAGGEVAWWRVTNARGELPAHLREEATRRWREEGIGVRPGGSARIDAYRADLERLADDFDRHE